MKTAISLPDPLFKEAEKMARKMKLSRSELYAKAIAAYVEARRRDKITEALNRVHDSVKEPIDPFVTEAARRILRRTEW